MNNADQSMQRNLDAFAERLKSWLPEHAGKYVVIADGALVDICDTYEAAIKLGFDRFPMEHQHYLLQRIAPLPARPDMRFACQGN